MGGKIGFKGQETILGFRPYTKYKSSGVDWLGNIPSHWGVKYLKYSTRLVYGDSLPSGEREDGDIKVFGSNGPVGNHNIVNTSEPVIIIGRKGSFGKINYSSSSCFAIDTTYFIDPSVTNEDLKWLFYILKSLNLDSFSEDSAVPGLSREYIYSLRIPDVPLIEQKKIASFLDQKNRHIDRLIDKQERLIELLEEKRTALISHVVTKGLDPDVEMKDSGVEWLGKIPSHWETSRLKFACKINPSKQEVSNISAETLVSFLPMEHIGENGELVLNYDKRIGEVFDGYTYFKNKDVIVAKITPCFENGKGAYCKKLTNEIGFGTTELHVLRPKPNFSGKYIYYLTKSYPFRKLGEATMYGAAGQKRVAEEFISNFELGFPDLKEQKYIVAQLDNEMEKIDRLIKKVEFSMNKLEEYRTSLISTAVTGKIDVRDHV